MACKRFDPMDIYDIIFRWHSGYKIRQISRVLPVDRKTIRRYVNLAIEAGLSQDKPLPEKDALLELLKTFIPENKRHQPARSVFEPHQDEITILITAATDPLKPKTAYEVICEQHGITQSYSSFKRFVREHLKNVLDKSQTTCRYETEPGEEMQIDYAKVGRLFDPLARRNRDIYAFIATLSFCRLKFIEFVYKQDQRSFVGSHLRMFEFFEGAPERLVIDNLKAGVIKPDLYAPHFNRSYLEMAEHFGCFIDPARPAAPKDKGKVERAVPLVRELFRKLKALYPELDISKANNQARKWCRETNGMKMHGTTGLKPFEVFQDVEKKVLKSLPLEPFEIATWKQAKVHVDQFIQFEKKFYSVPHAYVGKSVWVKGTEKLIRVFDDYTLIKQYPRSHKTRQFDPNDFPKNFRIMMADYVIQDLLARAQAIGPHFKKFILGVLAPHAKINYRRALGLLKLQNKYDNELMEKTAPLAIRYKINVPKQFERLLEKHRAPKDEAIPISGETLELIRPADYFIHSGGEINEKL